MKMTVEELYAWAVRNGCENHILMIQGTGEDGYVYERHLESGVNPCTNEKTVYLGEEC
jgi:hypothetical protein